MELVATVILEVTMIHRTVVVPSSTGLRTMEVAIRQQPGMTRKMDLIWVVMVGMVASELKSIQVHSIHLMGRI